MFKATIKTLEKGVNYVQSQQLKHHNDVIDVLVFLLLTLNIFRTSKCQLGTLAYNGWIYDKPSIVYSDNFRVTVFQLWTLALTAKKK